MNEISGNKQQVKNPLDRFVSCFLETKAAIQGEAVANATEIKIISDTHCRIRLPVKNFELTPPFFADAEKLQRMTDDLKRLGN